MKKNKSLAIWMDHSNAYLMTLADKVIETNTIVSEALSDDVEYSSDKHEKIIHKKEHHQLMNFYKKLSESIKKFEKVLLFGPTDAKKELLNLLKTDHHFEHIKIELRNTDKMTETQMRVFVSNYFSLNGNR